MVKVVLFTVMKIKCRCQHRDCVLLPSSIVVHVGSGLLISVSYRYRFSAIKSNRRKGAGFSLVSSSVSSHSLFSSMQLSQICGVRGHIGCYCPDGHLVLVQNDIFQFFHYFNCKS